ncbi:MAG TPA: hypothetical protein PKA77_15495 [Chitinophagaceae bacterium]|jgi:hypothetical protein|nr:hypothetical protein [Chitinophagaceae bacterium]HMU59579.1 hypothetical protein [Chitinophagaceae bacterium]
MKKILIIILVALSSNTVQSQVIVTDTLQWLQQNIGQQSSNFQGKPFGVLLDSLHGLNTKIVEYNAPQDIRLFSDEVRPKQAANKDTLFVTVIKLYFAPISDGGEVYQIHDTNFWDLFHKRTTTVVNTHVPYIRVVFSNPVPFLRVWCDSELGSSDWSYKIAGYYSTFLVQEVSVGEY